MTPGIKTKNLCSYTTQAAIKHYFPNFIRHLSEVADPRQQGKITYSAELILWMGVLERLAGIRSNNEYEGLLKVSTDIEKNIFSMPGISGDELPSIDTFCGFLQKLHPRELHTIIRKMIGALDRKKLLSKLKTKDGYLLLAIDGVQTISTKRDIGHSTCREHKDGEKTYHQYFLEAKIVSEKGLVLSIDTEFIENPDKAFDKQDCERKAAKRLLERIAKEHPHLKFRLLGDGLYCNSVFIDICDRQGWKYSLTFKGKTQYPKLLGEFRSELNCNQRLNKERFLLRKNAHTELYVELRWCNKVPYEFGGKKEHELNYLEGKIIRIKNGVETVMTTLAYLISDPINKRTVLKLFSICRRRWKIENEGFNVQKNGSLHIGHNFSSVGHAGQNFYLLAQIAHTIQQLAGFSDIAGHVRRAIDGDTDALSQTLKSIFCSFIAVAQRVKVEFFDKELKPPPLPAMRIRLKFA